MGPWAIVLAVTFVSLLALAFTIYAGKVVFRTEELLPGWAEQNGYRVIRKEARDFFKGPFFWTSSRHRPVYHLTVEDREGRRRNGWVALGDSWGGTWFGSDRVEVRWEDPGEPDLMSDG